MIVLICFVKAYLFLSVVYTISTLPQNISYHWKHSSEQLHQKIWRIIVAFALSMIFGGISILSRLYRKAKAKAHQAYVWYQIARTAKELTKTIRDATDYDQEQS